MTEDRNDRLETLYRQSGDVEPDAGLDRIVRARADEAARTGRSSSRLPWLGGLVTASVAVVAIAVVLQQSPPSQPAPESLAPDEPEVFMAPSMGAQSRPEESADAGQARSETRAEQDAPLPASRARAREAAAESASETRPPPARQAEPQPTSPASDDSVLDRFDAREGAALKSGDALIAKLRELIEAERIDEARRLWNEADELEPGLVLPEDIKRVLSGTDQASG